MILYAVKGSTSGMSKVCPPGRTGTMVTARSETFPKEAIGPGREDPPRPGRVGVCDLLQRPFPTTRVTPACALLFGTRLLASGHSSPTHPSLLGCPLCLGPPPLPAQPASGRKTSGSSPRPPPALESIPRSLQSKRPPPPLYSNKKRSHFQHPDPPCVPKGFAYDCY